MIPFIGFSLLRIKSLFIFSLLILLSFHAFSQAGKVDSTGMVTLRIDPQSARGAQVSQAFDEVKFIPLETTKESLFGSINSLKIVKSHFLIYDYDTKAVLIFTNGGKFKAKIDASKMPNDEGDKGKTELYSYQIAEENGDTFIVTSSSKYHFYFDLNGKQIKKVLIKDAKLKHEYKFADKHVTVRPFYLEKKGKDSTYYEVAILREGKDTSGYFPFSMKRYQADDFWGATNFYNYGIDNELFYTTQHTYNLYKITPEKLSLAYRVIFPANNSLPGDFLTNPIYVKKRGEYFQKNPKVFYGIGNCYLIGDQLYLQMRTYGSNRDLKKAVIYNLKTTELTSMEDLEPDSLSSFLPVTDAGAFYDFNNKGFHLYEKGYLYTSYSSLAMFTFKEQLGNKHDQFSPQMQDYFKTQNRKSNHIIIQLKPKKN